MELGQLGTKFFGHCSFSGCKDLLFVHHPQVDVFAGLYHTSLYLVALVGEEVQTHPKQLSSLDQFSPVLGRLIFYLQHPTLN